MTGNGAFELGSLRAPLSGHSGAIEVVPVAAVARLGAGRRTVPLAGRANCAVLETALPEGRKQVGAEHPLLAWLPLPQ